MSRWRHYMLFSSLSMPSHCHFQISNTITVIINRGCIVWDHPHASTWPLWSAAHRLIYMLKNGTMNGSLRMNVRDILERLTAVPVWASGWRTRVLMLQCCWNGDICKKRKKRQSISTGTFGSPVSALVFQKSLISIGMWFNTNTPRRDL